MKLVTVAMVLTFMALAVTPSFAHWRHHHRVYWYHHHHYPNGIWIRL